MKKFALAALCSVASLAFAQEGTTETTSAGDSPIKIFGNVDLNITDIDVSGGGKDDVDAGFNFAVGVDGAYMFTTDMGVALGLDFNMLKGEKDDAEVSGTYIDVPVSFAYSVDAMEDMNWTVLVGPYVGIPMGKWELKNGGTTKLKSKVGFGANLETHATWTLADDFALGGHLGFKYAFSNLLDEPGAGDIEFKYWAIGIGVGAKFL